MNNSTFAFNSCMSAINGTTTARLVHDYLILSISISLTLLLCSTFIQYLLYLDYVSSSARKGLRRRKEPDQEAANQEIDEEPANQEAPDQEAELNSKNKRAVKRVHFQVGGDDSDIDSDTTIVDV